MPTKKGKAKPAKLKKAQNKTRRNHPVGGAAGGRGIAKTRGGGTARRTTGPRRTKTGAAPASRGLGKAITPPPPLDRPGEERGDAKATGDSQRVVIL